MTIDGFSLAGVRSCPVYVVTADFMKGSRCALLYVLD